MGFEPTFAKKGESGFQDRHHKPLGHPSWLQILLQSDPPGNLADIVPAFLLDFDPTWIIYELAGQDITDNQWTCLNALLHNKPHYERLKKTGVFD